MSTKQWKEENIEKVRASRRKWYHANREKARNKIRERQKELNEWYADYKSALKYEMCSENHVSCLEFHHTDPSEKEMNVSLAVNNGWGKERILKEIEKCSVLCANCHKKLHWSMKKDEQYGGRSSVGRAPGCDPGRRQFESGRSSLAPGKA